MKNGSTTSLWSQIGSQPSEQQQVKAIQSDRRRKISRHGFGLRILGCARYYIEKRRTTNSEYYIALFVHLKEEIAKKQPQMKKKVLSASQCTVSQVDQSDGKTT